MILNDTLRLEFETHKPLDGSNHDADALPGATVYINGVLTVLVPVIVNLGIGRYRLTLPLTAANGFALNSWFSVVVTLAIDGLVTRRVLFEDSMTVDGYGPAMIFNQTIYPMFTTHKPSEGGVQDFDTEYPSAAPAIIVYNNAVLTALAPVVVNMALGLWMVALALTALNGFALGDEFSIIATSPQFGATIDGIGAENTVTGGVIVSGQAAGGGVAHHEIIGHMLRLQ